MDAVGELVVEVRIDVAVVDGGQGIAASQDALDGPAPAAGAAGCLARPVVGDMAGLVVLDPVLVQENCGIGMDGMIAAEVVSQEGGHGAGMPGRDVQQDVEIGLGILGREVYPNLSTLGLAVQGRGIVQHLPVHALRASGHASVDVLAEQLQHLGAAFALPRRGIGHWRAVGADKGSRQLVVRDERFVVVGLPGGGHATTPNREYGERQGGAGWPTVGHGYRSLLIMVNRRQILAPTRA
jgi:hypothetical protein